MSLAKHGTSLYRIDYEDCLPLEQTIEMARSRLGEAKYNPLENNCEHFARWCKIGERVCGQIETLLDRVKRVACSAGIKCAEELSLVAFLKATMKDITLKDGCKIAREFGMKHAQLVCGAGAKAARNCKV